MSIRKMRENTKSLFSTGLFLIAVLLLYQPTQAQSSLDITASASASTVPSGKHFTFTLQYSFASLVANGRDVKISAPIPSELEYVSAVQSVHTTGVSYSTANKTVTFTFIDPLPAGSTGEIQITVKFHKGSTANGTAATFNAQMTADDVDTEKSNTVKVTASAASKWVVQKQLISDAFIDYETTYRVKLCSPNAGDVGGLNLLNAQMVDTLNAKAKFVRASNQGVYDSTAHTVTWSLGTVSVTNGGCTNRTVTVIYPTAAFFSGDSVVNDVEGLGQPVGESFASLGKDSLKHLLQNFIANASASATKQIDFNEKVRGQTAKYTFTIRNLGNVALENYTFVDTIPPALNVTEIYTGKYSDSVSVAISYKTNLDTSDTALPGSPFVFSQNQTISVSSLSLAAGEHITALRWSLGKIAIGFRDRSGKPGFKATLLSTDHSGNAVNLGDKINNCVSLTYTYNGQQTSKQHCRKMTVIPPTARPQVTKEVVSTGNYLPGSTISYRIRVRNYGTATDVLENPILMDLLPTGLVYVDGSWSYDASGTGLASPIFEKIANYKNTGKTLLRWKWTGASAAKLQVNTAVYVSYNVKIKKGTLYGTLANPAYIAIDTGTFSYVQGTVTDANDLDGDGNTSEKIAKHTTNVFIQGVAALESFKWIKGQLDSSYMRYPKVGLTMPGGTANYRLVISNPGNVPIKKMVVIDILPYVGDTGVLTSSERKSKWRPNLIGAVTAPPGVSVYYSAQSNPCRKEILAAGPAGCKAANWTITPPKDITSVYALKFDFSNVILNPLDSLVLSWPMRAPVGAPENGEVAWNSFAYTGTRTDNNSTLLASEPIKVGIALSAARPPGAGNYTWLDNNRDGIQNKGDDDDDDENDDKDEDEDEPGLNGVRVDIYHVGADGNANTTDDSLAGFSVTGNNDDGKPGYYMFPFLAKGDYYLKFTPPTTDYRFSKQDSGEDDTVDSDADTTTGLTTKFNLSNAFDLKWDAGFYRLNADLDLAKKVNNPVPYVGDGILFTIIVTNNGPGGSDGVAVSIPLDEDLVYQSATQSRGSYDAQTGIWTIGDIKAGSSYTLWLIAKVTSTDAIECTAEISSSNAPDPDSTPGNKKRGEDDIGSATVFAGNVSGGSDAGLESNGDLSTLLAKRAFARKREHAMKIMKGIVDRPIPFRKGLAKSGGKIAAGFGGFVTGDLADLIPQTGPVNSTAFVSTPTDLFGATNATSVLAVDYLAPNQRRVAAIFSTTTIIGDTYDHTKIICDRVKGAILEDAWIVEVAEHPFVIAKLRHLNGALDFAISFVAYENPNGFTLDSRFVRGEYVSPAVGHTEVINFQVWSLAESFTIGIVEDILTLMQGIGTIAYLNTQDDPPGLPDVYVRRGRYEHGKLKLEMVNNVQAGQITIHGNAVSMENGPAFPLEKTVVLPTTANDDGFFDVEIETGPLFNIVFTIENDKTTTIDQIFLADGAWNVANDPNDARIDTHKVYVQDPQAFAIEGCHVERGAYIKGRAKTWAVLFRQLRPGNLPVDLSAYRFLEFTASGTGSFYVKVEKESIETFDHFRKRVELTAAPQRHLIWFEDLKQFTYTGDFTAEDVNTLSFVFEGSDGQEQVFEMRISDIRFGSVLTGVEALNLNGEIPREYTLAQNYPNPFNPTTTITFGLPKTGDVRLSVYDMLGREVVRLVEGRYRAGTYQVNFDAGKLASGHYIYRLLAGEKTLTRVMVLVK